MSAKRKVTSSIPVAAVQSAAVRQIIARSKPEDYDGHTEFERLSPSDRLDWLDAAVTFIEDSQRNLKDVSTPLAK
jgi:hypothetical protein